MSEISACSVDGGISMWSSAIRFDCNLVLDKKSENILLIFLKFVCIQGPN